MSEYMPESEHHLQRVNQEPRLTITFRPAVSKKAANVMFTYQRRTLGENIGNKKIAAVEN